MKKRDQGGGDKSEGCERGHRKRERKREIMVIRRQRQIHVLKGR